MTKQLKIERLQNAALQLMSKINSALETDAPEGLFRLSADKHLMDAKMSEIEKGKFNFDTLSQIERAALLKAVLRELRSEQGPLFTQEQFKQLTDVEMPVAVNGLLEQKKVADQKITFYLFELLKSLKKYEATTKMPTANLAIIFAPNLFPELPAPNVSKLSSEEALKKTRELQADNDAKVTFIADLVDKATVDPLVIPKPKLSTHYDYQVKAPSENRFHAFSATGKGLDEKFKNLTGDLLKRLFLKNGGTLIELV
ncbi:RhoGAP domain-containing protein [Legionella micdadei]|uniref:RhoGAP domain-containing protein n=1 Tax=Legionella micdadei TaxID=451 RepID=UPI0009EF7F22|nr:RhoGAP domain-containing protein [Legionella micdadei]ARG98990.1 hypothetical protein B6V88_00175 [Legionella micdadei]